MGIVFRRGWLSAPLVALAVAACGGGSHAKSASQGSKAAGAVIAHRLQSGWAHYEILSDPTIAGYVSSAIKAKPTLTQVGAIETTYIYLEQNAKILAGGTPSAFLRTMESKYPATSATVKADAPTLGAAESSWANLSPAERRACWASAISKYASKMNAAKLGARFDSSMKELLAADAKALAKLSLPPGATTPAITAWLDRTGHNCGPYA